MSRDFFNKVFDRVIGSEGGYQCDEQDRGNWSSGIVGVGRLNGTKFGLSAMTYPHLKIKEITHSQARGIYYRDWWVRLGMDKWHNALAYQVFDAAVNHGSPNAIRMLQRAAGVLDDGIAGPKTISAVNKMVESDLNDLLFLFIAERQEFFIKNKNWASYGKGWMARMAKCMRYAAEDN